MSEANGKLPTPALTVLYDPETQSVSVKCDPEQVKNWRFAAALLEMAKQQADHIVKMSQLGAIQHAQAEAAAQQKILSRLRT